jgi:ribonuclease HI
MKELELYIDGASKGNPGPSGIGVVICKDGQTIKNIASFIGNTTNNIAEYTALIYGLQEGLMLKAESLKINTDSQLLYRQINKVYKIKNPNLLGLYNQAVHLLLNFKEVKINHISRQGNRGADKLANKAIKEAVKKKVL